MLGNRRVDQQAQNPRGDCKWMKMVKNIRFVNRQTTEIEVNQCLLRETHSLSVSTSEVHGFLPLPPSFSY